MVTKAKGKGRDTWGDWDWYIHATVHKMGFPGGSVVKIHLPMQEPRVRSLGLEDSLDKEMATHPSILAWEIPWTEKPGGATVHRVTKESDVTERLKQQYIK